MVMRSALGSGSLKKSPAAVATRPEAGGGDGLGGDGLNRREIERRAAQVRMTPGDFGAEQAGSAADVAEGFEGGEIEFFP